jgi:hypothetical protein
LIDVRTQVTIGAAAAQVEAIAAHLDSIVAAPPGRHGMTRGVVEAPPATVGADVQFRQRTIGAGVEAMLGPLANAVPSHLVHATYVGIAEAPGASLGMYTNIAESADRSSRLPPAPETLMPTSDSSAVGVLASGSPSWDAVTPAAATEEVVPDAAATDALPTAPVVAGVGAAAAGDTVVGGLPGHVVSAPAFPPPAAPPVAVVPGASPGQIVLSNPDGFLALNITARLNQRSMRSLCADSVFWDNNWQLTLDRTPTGWNVLSNPSASNETLVNGVHVTSPAALRGGDALAVGRSAKGIVQLPLSIGVGAP